MAQPSDQVAAARRLLRQVCEILAEHREDAVLIGGWVPGLLFPAADPPHPGSIDVDVALRLEKVAYAKVVAVLVSRGFHQRKNGYEFVKEVDFGNGRKAWAKLDLLTSVQHQEEHFSHSSLAARPQAMRGTEMAFRNNAIPDLDLAGDFSLRVAGIVAFLVMKGLALHDRRETKDAYDILFCLENYPDGLAELAAEFSPFLGDELVRESLQKLAGKFRSEDDDGPHRVADHEQAIGEAREIRKRDAHARVEEFLGLVRPQE
jgi:hypothetical protein